MSDVTIFMAKHTELSVRITQYIQPSNIQWKYMTVPFATYGFFK
jgi:hypothetical protein